MSLVFYCLCDVLTFRPSCSKMSISEADFRKLFWMQGNFCVHYQWEIILSSIVLCIFLIRYADPSSSVGGETDVFATAYYKQVGLLYFPASIHFNGYFILYSQDTSAIITFVVGILALVQISSWLSRLWIKRKSIVVFWTILVFIVMVLGFFSAITLFFTNRTPAELV